MYVREICSLIIEPYYSTIAYLPCLRVLEMSSALATADRPNFVHSFGSIVFGNSEV